MKQHGVRVLSERDRALLRFVGEQYLVTLPQLAYLIGRSERTARWLRTRWQRAGLVEAAPLLVAEPTVVWLTRRGLAAVGLPWKALRPAFETVERAALAVEVRLAAAERYPHAVWLPRRALANCPETRHHSRRHPHPRRGHRRRHRSDDGARPTPAQTARRPTRLAAPPHPARDDQPQRAQPRVDRPARPPQRDRLPPRSAPGRTAAATRARLLRRPRRLGRHDVGSDRWPHARSYSRVMKISAALAAVLGARIRCGRHGCGRTLAAAKDALT